MDGLAEGYAHGLALVALLGDGDTTAVEGLSAMLTSQNVDSRRGAVVALRRLGVDLLRHLALAERVVLLVADVDVDVRERAANTLLLVGEPATQTPGFRDLMASELARPAAVRQGILGILAALKSRLLTDELAMAFVVDCLDHGDLPTLEITTRVLRRTGGAASRGDLAGPLCRRAECAETGVAVEAIRYLSEMGEEMLVRPEVTAVMRRLARSPDTARQVRHAAVRALGSGGRRLASLPGVIEILWEDAQGADTESAAVAVGSLAALGEGLLDRPDMLAWLLRGVEGPGLDANVRHAAARALKSAGPGVCEVPGLAAAVFDQIADPDEEVWSLLTYILKGLGSALADQPELLSKLDDCLAADSGIAVGRAAEAAWVLRERLVECPRTVQLLVDLVMRQDEHRHAAASSLSGLGEHLADYPDLLTVIGEMIAADDSGPRTNRRIWRVPLALGDRLLDFPALADYALAMPSGKFEMLYVLHQLPDCLPALPSLVADAFDANSATCTRSRRLVAHWSRRLDKVPGLLAEVAGHLVSDDPVARGLAAKLLRAAHNRLEDYVALDLLVSALQHPDPAIRADAQDAVSHIEVGPDDEPPLSRAIAEARTGGCPDGNGNASATG